MKAKIRRGSGFRGVLDYALSKDEPRIVGGNMSGQSPRELAKEFAASRVLRPDIGKPVWHSSLSAAPGERLTDKQWNDIAARYMKGMGFSESTQYVVIRHTPLQDQLNPPEPKIGKDGQPKKAGPECEHVHIVASRVGLDRKVWLGQNDVHLAIEQTQQLEREFGLVQTQGFDGPKAVKALTRAEAGMAERTGEMAPREYLQHTLAAIVATKPTMGEFIEQAHAAGIGLRANVASTGRMNGFSFERDGVHFSGQQLGASFKWGALQKQVDYQPERDTALLQGLSAKAAKPEAPAVAHAAPEPSFTPTPPHAAEPIIIKKEIEHGRDGRLGRAPEPDHAAAAGAGAGREHGHRDAGRGARAHDEPRHRAVEAARRPPAHLEGGLHHVSEGHVVLRWGHDAGALRPDVPRGLEFGRAAGRGGLFGTRGSAPAAAVAHLSSTGAKAFRPAGPSLWSRLSKRKKKGELTPQQAEQIKIMVERLAHLLTKLVCRAFGVEYQTPDERKQLERQRRMAARIVQPPKDKAHEAPRPEPTHEPKRPVPRPVDPERAKLAELAKASIGKPPAAAPAEHQHDPQAERREASRKVREEMERRRAENLEAQRRAQEQVEADRRAAERRRDEEIHDDREEDRRHDDREQDRRHDDAKRSIAKKGLSRSSALESLAERGDVRGIERALEEGAHVKGKALDAAAKGGHDEAFKKLVGGRSPVDSNDLKELARECQSPEAKAKLQELISQNKAGSSFEKLGIEGPKASPSGPSSGPSMSGPSMGGGRR